MFRWILVGAALAACQPARSAPAAVAPAAVESPPSPREPPVPVHAADEPAEEPAPDIGMAAAHEGVVFMRFAEICEAWQFVEGGTRIERIADASLDLRLSFQVDVRDGRSVTLTQPRADSRGATTAVECPEGDGASSILFSEEEDCEQQRRAIPIQRGCPSVLLDADRRSALLHRLEAGRRVALAAALDNAAQRVTALKRALRRRKVIYWQTQGDDGKATCEKWTWQPAKRRDDEDALVLRLPGGGTMTYGMYAALDERTRAATVNLLGPDYEGPGGGSSILHWDVRPLGEVTETFATVGTERWYFTRAACSS